MSYLKVKDRNKRYAIISVTRTLIMALLNILLLAVLKTGVRGYLIANICASAICVVLAATAGNAISDFTSASFNRTLCGEMIRYAAGRIQIMPGAGITLRNAPRIVAETGADQIHVAAHRSVFDRSVENNRAIFYGGCLYPPEDRFSLIDREIIGGIAEML